MAETSLQAEAPNETQQRRKRVSSAKLEVVGYLASAIYEDHLVDRQRRKPRDLARMSVLILLLSALCDRRAGLVLTLDS